MSTRELCSQCGVRKLNCKKSVCPWRSEVFTLYEGKHVTLVAVPEDEVPEQKGTLESYDLKSGTCIVFLDESEYDGDDGIREVPLNQIKGYKEDQS